MKVFKYFTRPGIYHVLEMVWFLKYNSFWAIYRYYVLNKDIWQCLLY